MKETIEQLDRNEISKILVKWGMGTRQVAINEIKELCEDYAHSFAKKILELLLENPYTPQTKEELAEKTGYALGGGFNNNIYRLTGTELILRSDQGYIINPEVLEL